MTFGRAMAPVMAGLMAVAGTQMQPLSDQRPPGCSRNMLSISTNAGSQPTVRAVGAQGVESASIQVNTYKDLPGVFFAYSLGQVRGPATSPPSFAWQFDGGGWQSGTLSSGFSGGTWTADPGPLGDFTAGSTHTLEFAITFTSAAQAGAYSGDLQIGSFMCGNVTVGAPLFIAFAPPSPSATPKPSASRSSASPSASATPSMSASPSASPSPSSTPSASASPSLSESATPVAAVKAAVSSGGGGSGMAITIAGLVVLLGLVAAFVPGVLRQRRTRADGGESAQ